MENVIVVSVLSSFGLGLSLFLCMLLFRTRNTKSRLLALLFLFLTLRITKSVFYGVIELPLVVKNLGLAANLAVAPLLYLYALAVLRRKEVNRLDLLHFIPTVLFVVFSAQIPNGPAHPLGALIYTLILTQSFAYVLMTVWVLHKHPFSHSPEVGWVYLLTACLSTTWLMYTFIFLEIVPMYSLGPITFSLVMFLMMYYFIVNRTGLQSRKKYVNASISDEEGREHLKKMREVLSHRELFRDPALSLSKMADILGISERNVSLIVNKHAGQNFASFVHTYRVEEAQRILRSPEQHKVLSVAYEVGYNNLATFNYSFKKQTGMTPSDYRAIHSRQSKLIQDS